MKPKLSMATVLVVALGCVAAGGDVLEALVPSDAVAFVELSNTQELRDGFAASALGSAARSSRLLDYLRTVASAAWGFAGTVVTGLPAQELEQLLGERVGLALLDFKNPADLKARVPVVLLVEAADPRRLEEALTSQLQLLSVLRPELEAGQRKHDGVAVHEVSLPAGRTLSFCIVGKVLAAGTREGVAALLDAQGQPGRLGDNALYARLRQRLGADGLFAYVDLGALKAKSGVGANPMQLRALGALGLANSQAAALSIGFDGGQVRERLFVHTGPQPTGLARLLAAGRPTQPTTARFVPKGYTALLALSLRDVGLWDRLRTMLVQSAGPGAGDFLESIVTRIQQQHGIHLKNDILDTLGDELVLAVDLSRLKSFFGAGREPLPEEIPVLLAARVAKPATLVATLDKLAANQALWEQGVARKARKVGGQTLYSFALPLNPDLRPSYVLSGDALLASARPEPLAAGLEAARTKASFALRTPPPQQPCHAMVQLNDAALLSTLLGCIREELPQRSSKLVGELDALIAGLHGYQATLRREQDGLLFEARSDLGTAGTLLLAVALLDQGNRIVARRVEADFTAIAQALEKYREEKGHYPETLDQLVPDFLPQLTHDRFAPGRAYGYSRGQPGPDGKLPDAWLLTSVGPDKRPNIPVEQFDPPNWARKLQSNDPQDVQLLKRLIYRFHPERYRDERKNDDEGDLARMGGRALQVPPPPPPAPRPPRPKQEPADDNF